MNKKSTTLKNLLAKTLEKWTPSPYISYKIECVYGWLA